MPEFTSAQLEAINSRGCDLLVSAAAGSGKTTALTERIIKRIEEGGDIGRMLVVTFSRASAADMKKKITKALRDRAEAGGDERFLRQLSRVGDADIKTIHAFCFSIVKHRFAELSLSPRVRIAEEAETEEMRASVMSETLDAFYEADARDRAGSPEHDVSALADQLAGGGDDAGMEKLLLGLYEKTSCTKRGIMSISDSADAALAAADGDFFSSPQGEGIKKLISDGVEYYSRLMEAALFEIENYEEFSAKYRAAFEGVLSGLRAIEAALGEGYEKTEAAIEAFSAPGFGKTNGEKPASIVFFAGKKNRAAAFVRDIKDRYFSSPKEARRRSAERTAEVCRGVVRVLSEFEKRYAAEKRRRAVVDYDDLEHMALTVLLDREAAEAVAASYDDIYIDEYQDVSEVQDEILSLISRENRFLVGDVKQAIYGFRGSDPGIFGTYRDRIKTVFMSENFRCDETVINFANAVCGELLPLAGIPYGECDALRHAKNDAGAPAPVRVVITSPEDEAERAAELAEAEIAAGREPGDIAILLRSAKTKSDAFVRALKRHGIPVSSAEREGFFEAPEVMLAVSLLRVCDNPLYDIHLAAVLRSPVFGFDLDELVRLKAGDRRPLWRVLCDVAEGEGELSDKCRDACETIRGWREASRLMPADEAVRLLTVSTGLEALLWSEKNGGEARAAVAERNLFLLYDTARRFEAHGFGGLHRFITYLDTVSAGTVTKDAAPAAQSGGVSVMTVHKSKGLEFPVVILAGCGSDRNERDATASVLWEKDAGMAMKLRADEEGSSTVMLDTVLRQGVAQSILRRGAAEELRILYVALTRARERLVILGASDKAEERVDVARREAEFLCGYTVLKNEKSYLGLILTALFASGAEDVFRLELPEPKEAVPPMEASIGSEDGDESITESETELRAPDPELTERYRAVIEERLSYRYPFEKLGALPAKLSVSRLMPGILDEDATELVSARSATEPGEAAKAGTATHLYMQFCDYKNAAEDARAEGERLLAAGYITREDMERIRFDEVEKFFASELYRRIEAADEVWRERRFNVRLPAEEFTENEADRELYRGEELLVQGVIDCFFRERDGGLVLVDYKTDRLSQYELSHPEAADEKLRERHARQLSYYAAAIEKIFGEPPKKTLLYSMCAGRAIEIK